MARKKHTYRKDFPTRSKCGALQGKEPLVRGLRKAGWTQERVAKLLGVHRKSISQLEKRDRGECLKCSEEPVAGHSRCPSCLDKNSAGGYDRRRTPIGWADNKAAWHRERARRYSDRVAVYGIVLRTDITGPEVLAAVRAHGCHCGIEGCTYEAAWPWEMVGEEEGFELDHIDGIGTIINEGRDDWIRPENLRLLCPRHHREEGQCLKIEEEALEAFIARSEAKDCA